MEEKTLLKVALLCSLLGILVLLIISEHQDTSSSNIANITENDLDHTVTIKGKITALKETPTVSITKVKDATGSITVIMFRQENIQLQKEELISVEGIAKKFNNEVEIEAKLVKVF